MSFNSGQDGDEEEDEEGDDSFMAALDESLLAPTQPVVKLEADGPEAPSSASSASGLPTDSFGKRASRTQSKLWAQHAMESKVSAGKA